MRLLDGFSSTSLSTEEIIMMMVEDHVPFQEIGLLLKMDRKLVGRIALANLEAVPSPWRVVNADRESELDYTACSLCSRRVKNVDMPARYYDEKPVYSLPVCHICYDISTGDPFAFDSLARRVRAKENNVKNGKNSSKYTLPNGYLGFLYWKQQGKCFLTDRSMEFAAKKPSQNSASLDRVLFSEGYEMGNVVLIINKANVVKSDMDFEEMAKWTPEWHARLQGFLEHKNDYVWSEER